MSDTQKRKLMVRISKNTTLFSMVIIAVFLYISIVFFSNRNKNITSNASGESGESGESSDLLSFNSDITDIDRYKAFHSTIHDLDDLDDLDNSEKVENFIPPLSVSFDPYVREITRDRIRAEDEKRVIQEKRSKMGYIMGVGKDDDYYSPYSSTSDSYMELDTSG
jgi:hypothetical protein